MSFPLQVVVGPRYMEERARVAEERAAELKAALARLLDEEGPLGPGTWPTKGAWAHALAVFEGRARK